MKTPKISKNEVIKFAKTHNAVEFDAFCEANRIQSVWMDVNIMNYNEDYYNVELPQYGLFVAYYYGKLEEIYDL